MIILICVRAGRELTLTVYDPSMNTGQDESRRYLFDANSAPSTREETDDSPSTKTVAKSQGKVSNKSRKTRDSTHKELKESNV